MGKSLAAGGAMTFGFVENTATPANSWAYFGVPYGSDETISSVVVKRNVAGTSGIVGIGTNAPTAKLHIDQTLSADAIPVLTLDQADVSEEFIRFIGTAAAATLTQSIVDNGDVAAATLRGWVKVYVTDTGDQITDQVYYQPLYTLA
jgi:hypothetical protein